MTLPVRLSRDRKSLCARLWGRDKYGLRVLPRRSYDPREHDGSWVAWRWFDITSQGGPSGEPPAVAPVYLRRLYVVRTPWFSVMLHRILSPDPDVHLHDHPWSFVAFVLRGWYLERRVDGVRLRSWWNLCHAQVAHKIEHVSDSCTTLVLTGPKRRSWGFHTGDGWVGWYQYLYGNRAPSAGGPN